MFLVAEEFKDVTEGVQIPLHLTVDQPVSNKTWDQLRKYSNVTNKIVVSVALAFNERFWMLEYYETGKFFKKLTMKESRRSFYSLNEQKI